MIGRTLAHYRITAALGAGGMGEVYRATDTKLGREIALKVLPAEMARDPDRFARFQREARAVASLNHPHIVTLHSIEEADGTHFLTMELVEGESLERAIPECGLPAERILSTIAAVADALSVAHEKGIVHRDLKPANVMVSQDGRVKVLDFGLAKELPSDEPSGATQTSTQHTQVGAVLGTPAYMSPEQLAGREVDHRTDVFSLGIVMYQMASGRLPFSGPSRFELASSILRDTPVPLEQARPDLPAELSRVVARCLAKDPSERYQSAREIAAVCRGLVSMPVAGAVFVAPARDASSGAAAPARPSIVVLPFVNLSPDPDNAYFSDGLTEEIIADLSKVQALRVISRTSAMQLKGQAKDVRTIGRELGVRYVLEGGVRKAGNSLRITAQLIDAATDTHVWSEKFNGTLDDVFDVQERVSREIVRALDVTLTSDEGHRLAERPIASPRAFELFLQARAELRRMSGDAVERASALLTRAVEIEGTKRPLLALMAWAKVAQVRAGVNRDMRPLEDAERDARRMLVSDAASPHAHALIGYIAYERGDHPTAVRHLGAAIDRDPSDTDALFFLGISYIAAGQNEAAHAAARRLLAVDPLAALAWLLSGVAKWFVGNFEDAVADFRRAVELDPQSFIVHWTAGYLDVTLGRITDASRHAEFLRGAGPNAPYTRQLLSLVAAFEGRRDTALRLVEGVEASQLDAHNKFHLGESFAYAGETSRALDLIEQAVDEGFYPYPFMAVHCPFLESLQPLPRFASILAKAKMRMDAFRADRSGAT